MSEQQQFSEEYLSKISKLVHDAVCGCGDAKNCTTDAEIYEWLYSGDGMKNSSSVPALVEKWLKEEN